MITHLLDKFKIHSRPAFVWILVAISVGAVLLFGLLESSIFADGQPFLELSTASIRSRLEPAGNAQTLAPVDAPHPSLHAGAAQDENPRARAGSQPGAQARTGVRLEREIYFRGKNRNSVDVTGAFTYTAALPLVIKGYWQAAESGFGVQLFRLNKQIIVETAQTGVRWVRIPFKWRYIEPENTTPDKYQWSASFEAQLADLSARNISIILTLDNNPPWASTYPNGPVDLVDIGELTEFMKAAVDRYSVPPYNVKHWEIYNEPDNGDPMYAEWGWGYFGNQPEAYVATLAAVYQPLKNIDPEAQIVFGGLAYDNWTTTGGPFVPEFLDNVLQNGGAAYFDVMNFHYYPAFQANWNPYGPGIVGKATFLRNKLADYGAEKPFICTEASMWSDETHDGSDELQSRYVPQVFARSMAADLDLTIWFKLLDDEGLGGFKYGLLNPDLSSKPSRLAYQTLARQLAPSEFVRSLGPSDIGTDQIEAYEFLTDDASTTIIVAWNTAEQITDIPLMVDQVLMVDKFGLETVVSDGDDGVQDGRTWVDIGPSPLYLRISQ